MTKMLRIQSNNANVKRKYTFFVKNRHTCLKIDFFNVTTKKHLWKYILLYSDNKTIPFRSMFYVNRFHIKRCLFCSWFHSSKIRIYIPMKIKMSFTSCRVSQKIYYYNWTWIVFLPSNGTLCRGKYSLLHVWSWWK